MTYVALLRGINVGGNSIVDMRRLRTTFERLGFADVHTYINSGNVLFSTRRRARQRLTGDIETAIVTDLGLDVAVQLRSGDELRDLIAAIPAEWTNDGSMKCDVYFLWPAIDRPAVIDDVPHNPAIEDLCYLPGALVRRVDRSQQAKSPMTRIVGTAIYQQMTARNINTVRKLAQLATA